MNKQVTLSDNSKDLLEQYRKIADKSTSKWSECPDAKIELKTLTVWLLQQIDSDKDSRFLLEQLRLSLLKDLDNNFVSGGENKQASDDSALKWYQNTTFMLLTLAGTLFAICDGFDGIAAIVGLFNAAPLAILIAGLTFSVLSVIVFFGFDLINIANNVGVNINNSVDLLDVILKQVESIASIRKNIDDTYFESIDIEELENLQRLTKMLIVRFEALDQDRKDYQEALDNPVLKAAKFAIALVTGVLFFSSGFFAGQTLALAIAGVAITAATPAMLPVMLTSVFIGLCALATYWYVERPGLENLVGRWCGLDKNKIDALADEKIVANERKALILLERKIEQRIQVQEQIGKLNTRVDELLKLQEFLDTPKDTCKRAPPTSATPRLGNSPFTLFRSKSTGDLSGLSNTQESGLRA